MKTSRFITLLTVIGWAGFIAAAEYWEHVRPSHAIPREGYTFYFKGDSTIVYLNRADHLIYISLCILITILTISSIISGIWLKLSSFADSRQEE